MITVNLTYAGRLLPNGLHRVNLYVTRENDEQFDLSPIAERKALEDAKIIVDDIVRVNKSTLDDRLLKEGSPAPDDSIVCRAKIAIRWDRNHEVSAYLLENLVRICMNAINKNNKKENNNERK